MAASEPKQLIRVLHIVGGMDTGGVETWLMHILRRIDRSRYQFDFLTHTTRPCFYDDEIRALGGRIIPCPRPSRPWSYVANFVRIVKTYGPYDVVHSHVHHFTGLTMLLAHLARVPMRIAHSHNNTSLHEERGGLLRRCYLRVMRWLIRCHATRGLACSADAAVDLFTKDWEKDLRWQVLYCGIDLDPFYRSVSRDEVRRELRIPLDAFVLGHVGRFSEQKNHDFLLDIFAEVVRCISNCRLLLVGDGALREATVRKATRLGIEDKVIFAGVRADVPRLMMGAMDVFVFPSLYEGLGLVLVEAQAAGLPAVISNVVPDEAIVIHPLVKALSLRDDVLAWAQAAMECGKIRLLVAELRQVLERSEFNIAHGVNELCQVYCR